MGGGEEDGGWKRKVSWRDPTLIGQKKRRERFLPANGSQERSFNGPYFRLNSLKGTVTRATSIESSTVHILLSIHYDFSGGKAVPCGTSVPSQEK